MPSPTLPPEIIREIFLCLAGGQVKRSVLDLMAASMVCRNWYAEARAVIPQSCLQELFPHEYDNYHYGINLRRIASLLTSAHELGLPYCTEVTEFTVSLTDFVGPYEASLDNENPRPNFVKKAYEPEDHEALFTILKFISPTHLLVPLKVKDPQRGQFFSRLTKHCGSVSQLQLLRSNNGSPLSPTVASLERPNKELIDLIEATRLSLRKLVIFQNLDAPTQAALTRCPNIQIVIFRGCSVCMADNMLRELWKFRTLRMVRARNLVGTGTESLLETLSNWCTVLEDLIIINTPRGGLQADDIPRLATALELVVSRGRSLKRLELSQLIYMNEAVLRAVAIWCRDLEDLSLVSFSFRRPDATGADFWSESETVTPWPQLRRLRLPARLPHEFLERMLETCDELTEVKLWPTLRTLRIWEILQHHGFEPKNTFGMSWRREKKALLGE